MIGLDVSCTSTDWVVVSTDDHSSGFAFQRAPGYVAPSWPGAASSQQVHLDVVVDDLDEAGHPSCLVRRPAWAPPIAPGTGAGDA